LKWTEQQLQAITLLLAGRLTHEKIAATCHVPARTLREWMTRPDWQAKYAEMRANVEAAVAGVVYADKTRRIIALSEMAESARVTYEEHPLLREIRPLPQKASVRIRVKARDGEDEPPEETEPLDAIVNESYNEAAFAQFRGALDDIAKELGHRRPTAVDDAKQGNLQVVFMLPPQGATPDGARTVEADVPPSPQPLPPTQPTIAIEFPPLDE
jgi:hypothetical protein